MTFVRNPRSVLKLYRDLLKYGKDLKLTDKKFFTERIKKEFRSNKDLECNEKIEFFVKKGQTLLDKKSVM